MGKSTDNDDQHPWHRNSSAVPSAQPTRSQLNDVTMLSGARRGHNCPATRLSAVRQFSRSSDRDPLARPRSGDGVERARCPRDAAAACPAGRRPRDEARRLLDRDRAQLDRRPSLRATRRGRRRALMRHCRTTASPRPVARHARLHGADPRSPTSPTEPFADRRSPARGLLHHGRRESDRRRSPRSAPPRPRRRAQTLVAEHPLRRAAARPAPARAVSLEASGEALEVYRNRARDPARGAQHRPEPRSPGDRDGRSSARTRRSPRRRHCTRGRTQIAERGATRQSHGLADECGR